MTTTEENQRNAYQQHGIDCAGLHEEREPAQYTCLSVALAQVLAQQLPVLPKKAEMANE